MSKPEDACCAHLTVRYQTEPANDPEHPHAVRGWWQCKECSMRFVPQPVMDRWRLAVKSAPEWCDDGSVESDDSHCAWCDNRYHASLGTHKPDCLWVRAQED